MKSVVLLKSRAKNKGGLEKYASRIANAFIEKGAKVTILSTGSSLPDSEIPVFATKTIPWPAFLRMEQYDHFVKKWLETNRVDLVFGMDRNRHQTHFRAGNGVHAAYLKSRFQTDSFLKASFCYINPLHRKILELEKAAFENPLLQKLFTNSEMVKKQVLYYYNVDPKKIQVIHNGVEWQEMQNDFDSWQEKKEKHNPFHFLFIGNGYSRKGLDRLLFALSQMANEPFHLSVIGKENQIEKYKSITKRLGLKEKVTFYGPSHAIRHFYQIADCLVIPSFYDPFANVTIEALAMGIFVLSSKHNGGHEILNSENGSIIEDLLNPDSILASLKIAMQHRKTEKSAKLIRESVKDYDFSNQLKILMDSCG